MTNREQINRHLGQHGLAQLDDQSLVLQIAYLIEGHNHFRQLLCRCVPEERRNMYEALKPHLRFRAAPLDVYIAEAGRIAQNEQQMTVDTEGQFHAFHASPEINSESD